MIAVAQPSRACFHRLRGDGDSAMRSRILFGAFVTAALLSTAPAIALQQVMLPQPGDSTTNAQYPNNPSQDQFSTGQSDSKTDGLGSFHFGVTSGSDWPGDRNRYYHPQISTPDAYGSASTPGSEFSNFGYPFPR
jgi:hypothetical protein